MYSALEAKFSKSKQIVRFAIDFANLKLDQTLSGADVSKLKKNFDAFFDIRRKEKGRTIEVPQRKIAFIPLQDDLQNWSIAEFRNMQDEISSLLAGVTKRSDEELIPNQIVPGSVSVETPIVISTGRNAQTIISTTRVAFLLTFFFALEDHLDRVYRCSICNRFFYKIKKQKYCSRQCTLKANFSDWYPKNKSRRRNKAKDKHR